MKTLGILRLSGENTESFLQGQLTCDMRLLKKHGDYSLAACCDHRGRVLANFWVVRWEEDYLFILPKNMCDITQTHLTKYAVFSKVSINNEDQLSIQKASLAGAVVNSSNNHSNEMTDEDLWRKQNIQDGLVLIQPKTSLLFTPQMINLDKLSGVSFTKGCYVGQEIIARTQHLGTLKRHLHRMTLKTPLQPGDPLKNDTGEEIGVIADAIGLEALAVIEDRFM
ncbi:MAG: hypothetical protein A3E84_00790 [Gammaproteobacteria bacterium RIFCSPHIGHO2_12_FULL_42_13]|nr:MAG: hypothetical protein A3E84_00790 [Gammaproteobacteria bacterium RIFCSPHIGHO2_12_FULL_42_13]